MTNASRRKHFTQNWGLPLAASLLSLSCAHVQPGASWGGQLTGGRSRFNQSCGPACATPVNVSTGEMLAPAALRVSPVAWES